MLDYARITAMLEARKAYWQAQEAQAEERHADAATLDAVRGSVLAYTIVLLDAETAWENYQGKLTQEKAEGE